MDFEFFTSADAALVTGLAKSSNNYGKNQPVTSGSGPYSLTIYKNEQQVKPIVDISTGFVWDKSYKNWGIMFKAAYEAHLLFDIPQFIYSAETYGRNLAIDSQLCFQGLTLGAGVRF